jgi:hypothetical protein
MLKRNGENCEHPVPNYPGLLTASEFKAYNVAVPLVAEEVRLFNERADHLSEIEKQSAQIAEQVAAQPAPQLFAAWHTRHALFKSPRSEILLCSRGLNGKEQFGIIEQFGANAPYARKHGETDLQMTGNNVFVLLQNYVEGERSVLQLFRKDIEATVEEKLLEKFPSQNHSRVVRAISARCENQMPVESEKEKPAKSVKIRM